MLRDNKRLEMRLVQKRLNWQQVSDIIIKKETFSDVHQSANNCIYKLFHNQWWLWSEVVSQCAPVISGPSAALWWSSLHALTSPSRNHCAVHKCSVKTLSCKEEAAFHHDPETLLSSVGQSSLKMALKWKTVLWSDESKKEWVFSSRLKERGHPALMLWSCTGATSGTSMLKGFRAS